MRNAMLAVRGLFAAALLLGCVAGVHAGVASGVLAQRRGTRYIIPPKAAPIESAPMIDTLNRALKALGSTNIDYGGHRVKAIGHIGAAIQQLEPTNVKGKPIPAVQKAIAGSAPVLNKTATTPEAASAASLHKAKTLLFAAHHKLVDHTATRGRIRADAQVRLAIDEVVAALKPGADKPADSAEFAPADIPTTGPNKPTK